MLIRLNNVATINIDAVSKKGGNKRENPLHFSLKTIVGGKKETNSHLTGKCRL